MAGWPRWLTPPKTVKKAFKALLALLLKETAEDVEKEAETKE